jgi:hypothetical protein
VANLWPCRRHRLQPHQRFRGRHLRR